MSTMYTIRVDRETDRLVKQLAAARRVTRSEIIREALRQLVLDKREVSGKTAYDLSQDLIGAFRSRRGDLSVRTGAGFRKKLRARRERQG